MYDKYLITGGAGFIGTNVADYYLSHGKRVTILDNFSRPGAEQNARWLQARYDGRVKILEADVRRSGKALARAVGEAEVVFHLAAQVAVTTSVQDPRSDFEVNALGTFNVLEAARTSSSQPIVVYSSTNKVYGKMADLEIREENGRYAYMTASSGIPGDRGLDFYSPYGCSKGAGDQYTIDYARIYGLKTIVFRQSCIYGPHQFGMEDQGWVAWFSIRAMQGRPVAIYGDGKQVRDVLYVDDLIAAYDAAVKHIEITAGRSYNIGGGPRNTLSLLELIDMLEERFRRRLEYSFEPWRPGDQLLYISDVEEAYKDFGWRPRVGVAEGVCRLLAWLQQNQELFATPNLAVAGAA